MTNTKTPDGAVELHEEQLNQAAGTLLLPAVQKVREAAARTTNQSGVNVLLGDGSVRIADGTSN